MRVGEYEVFSIVENRFYLDGGAMFGIIPKVIWQKLIPADENNLIPLDTNILLVKHKNKNILIDGGIGDNLTEKERKIYGLYTPSNLEAGLLNYGVRPEEVNFVIFSHLHADHSCGTIKAVKGRELPRFPKAVHLVQKTEWEDASHPDERTGAAYLINHLEILEKHKLLKLVQGDEEIFPGLKVKRTGGHTSGHQAIILESEGQKLVFYADIIPTSAHLRIPYVASIDLFPLETMRLKRVLLPELYEEQAYVAFDHDLKIKIAKIKKQNGNFVAVPVE